MLHEELSPDQLAALADHIRAKGQELGFQAIRFARTDLSHAEAGLLAWLDAGCHGGMDYMAKHGLTRARPDALVPGTRSVICARMNYRPDAPKSASSQQAQIAHYALGRDYHKVLRSRLQKLTQCIEKIVGPFGHRVFTDSAPVMEVELASQCGLGWRGKNTLLLNREAGSYFFLGEIYCELPFAPDPPEAEHCGRCRRCLDHCPTDAFLGPGQLDARRCISYLTIEHDGPIPEQLRPLMGNHIYGCDDCQSICPWNRFAPVSAETDFQARHGLDQASLLTLWAWTEEQFRTRMAGSPILRIGFERWRRNLAVALGNAPRSPEIIATLEQSHPSSSPLVQEHIDWALAQQRA